MALTSSKWGRWGRGSSTSTAAPARPPAGPGSDRGERDRRHANAPVYDPFTYAGYYNRTPEQKAAAEDWRMNEPYGTRTHQGFANYMNTVAPSAPPGSMTLPPGYLGGGGGGGRGGGGGGGGGGGMAPPALSQAMFDQMLAALGTSGPGLSLQQVDLPDFQGQDIPAFDAAMFDQLQQNLNTAVERDTAAINQGAQQATGALQANYSNAYANTPVAAAPQMQAVGAGLEATAGGGGPSANQAAAASANQAGASNQADFTNLLRVLGAADTQAQGSRLNQVALDQQSAQRQLGAQNLGLGSQIGMMRNNAQTQWQQRDAERRYQNSLMQQQQQREEMMRNQDIANQQAQGNWQQRNEMISNRLSPLLQLLGQTQGTGLNADALQQILAGWRQ